MMIQEYLKRFHELANYEINDLEIWLKPMEDLNDEMRREHGMSIWTQHDIWPRNGDGSEFSVTYDFHSPRSERIDFQRHGVFRCHFDGESDRAFAYVQQIDMPAFRTILVRQLHLWDTSGLGSSDSTNSKPKTVKPRFKPPPCPKCGEKPKTIRTEKTIRRFRCPNCHHFWKASR